MILKRHIRRLIGILTGLAASVAAAVAVAPSAFATQVHTHTAISIGMPGWQIVLIAVGAAIVAAALAVLLDRMLVARQHPTPTHA
jgi:uncharacterized membrane protein